jgi:outer membrane receptor protein involved in Fe transport
MVLTGSTVSNPSQYWKDLKPEVVDHYEVGLTHTWPKTASLGATAFYDKGKDRFQAYMFGSIPLQFNDPIGHYEIRGLELTGTLTPVKTIELFAGATWLEAEATGNDGIERDHMPYTPSFQFQAGAKWNFLENYRLTMDMQHMKNVYAATSARSGSFNYSELTDSSKLDDMTVCNARLSYRLTYQPLRLNNAEISLAVNNIFNQNYEYAKGYSMPGITFFAGFSMKFN